MIGVSGVDTINIWDLRWAAGLESNANSKCWIPELPAGVDKRPTALPLSTFKIHMSPEGVITAILVTELDDFA